MGIVTWGWSSFPGSDVVATEAHLKVPVGIPALPPKPDGLAFVTRSKPATSGSSREQSDEEDENDGMVNDQNLEPGDMKRVKRYTTYCNRFINWVHGCVNWSRIQEKFYQMNSTLVSELCCSVH